MVALLASAGRLSVRNRGAAPLEEGHSLFEYPDFLSFYVFIHALALQASSSGALASPCALRGWCTRRSNDKVV